MAGDGAAPERYVPAFVAAAPAAPDDLCVPVSGQDAVLVVSDAGVRLPSLSDLGKWPDDLTPLGSLGGRPVWGAGVTAVPAGLTALDWNTVAARTDTDLTHVVARGVQIVPWRAQTRWCGACRGPLADIESYLGRTCPACQLNLFVPSQPVALVGVMRDGPDGTEILLARHTYRDTRTWLLVGGFVDPAETLEQAAVREAEEEAGLVVTDLAYRGSQAWGMGGPGILVTLFTARPVDPTAEPRPDRHELSDARFFPLTALPEPLPPRHHISGQLLVELAT